MMGTLVSFTFVSYIIRYFRLSVVVNTLYSVFIIMYTYKLWISDEVMGLKDSAF